MEIQNETTKWPVYVLQVRCEIQSSRAGFQPESVTGASKRGNENQGRYRDHWQPLDLRFRVTLCHGACVFGCCAKQVRVSTFFCSLLLRNLVQLESRRRLLVISVPRVLQWLFSESTKIQSLHIEHLSLYTHISLIQLFFHLHTGGRLVIPLFRGSFSLSTIFDVPFISRRLNTNLKS